MSVTIITRNRKVKPLLPNMAGWRLYGHINAISQGLIYLENGDVDFPRPPDHLTKSQAIFTAKLIEMRLFKSKHAADRMKELDKRSEGLYSGSLEKLVKGYMNWLKKCDGYRLI